MLENARLYKDEKGNIWHVMEDGTAMQYPTFTHHDKPAKGLYIEVSLLHLVSTPVGDNLYLAMLDNGKTTLVVAEAFNKASCFDIFTGDCIVGNFDLFPVANLICGHEYMIRGHKMTLVHFREEAQGFSFIDDKDGNCDSSAFIGVHQIRCVKEMQKMPREYKV